MIFNNTANTYKEYEVGVVGEPRSDTEDKTKLTLQFSVILTGAHAHVHSILYNAHIHNSK